MAKTARALLVIACGISGAALAWAVFSEAQMREYGAERRALDVRAAQLVGAGLRPGSPLACLDAAAGETVQGACESAIFATPTNVASALSYVATQFALLADMTAFRRAGGADIDSVLVPLRRDLEADPFGLLAHLLVVRDRCTSVNCPPLRLLSDPAHVRTNMIAQTFEHYVEQYRDAWAKLPGTVAEPANLAASEGSAAERRRGAKLDLDFPSAASIPAISIMKPEPEAERHAKPGAAGPARRGGPGGEAKTDPVWVPAPGPAQP